MKQVIKFNNFLTVMEKNWHLLIALEDYKSLQLVKKL